MIHSHMSRLIREISNTSIKRKFCSTQSSKKCVLVDKYNDITLISLNRPHKRNCLNVETIFQLKEALCELDNDVSAAIGILYGEGGIFCSGFDIDEIIEKGYEPILKACEEFKEGPLCRKPIIAAVDGFAVAEGFELALACDMRVIEQTASLGFLGRRFGSPTLLGGVQRLSDLIGASRAMNLLCSGLQINGELANSWGLATRCVSTGTCIGQATNLAISVAKYPQNGVIHDKLELYKHLQRDKYVKYEKDNNFYKVSAIKDIEENSIKFKEGLGKHGKFKNIKILDIPEWEKQEEVYDKA